MPPEARHYSVEEQLMVQLDGGEIWATTGPRLQACRVRLQPGFRSDPHAHPHEQLTVMVEGSMTVHVGEDLVPRLLEAGETIVIEGGVRHGVVVGDAGAFFIETFTPPRDDYS